MIDTRWLHRGTGGGGLVIVWVPEGDRVAELSSAASPPDPVHVGLHVPRHVKVNHVRDALDVEPAGCHVGGEHQRQLGGHELPQRLVALVLSLVAVDRACPEALPPACPLSPWTVESVPVVAGEGDWGASEIIR
jgi:hypothetical protein